MYNVLSIAGSDSSGGAGIQADLKAFAANGVYGMTVITAVTAQNTRGVNAVRVLDPEIVTAQIDAVFSDIRVDAVKIGMLADSRIISEVAEALRRWKPPVTVLDPVMVAKSGHRLLAPDAEESLKNKLLPLADLVTPNLPEAESLSGLEIESADTAVLEKAARRILELGAGAVLIKGGHSDNSDSSTDILVDRHGTRHYTAPRLEARHTHGTGCSLSSALAALLARGFGLEQSVTWAKAYINEGIAHGLAIGGGCGPIHHFYSLYGGEELEP
ncbi:bifunctional hydroxymethylpyrimidine kinase/phosphomethylpyrimidine kinase [Marispirochaeta sp.]|jgi:hydroxymethylpyrimidine/phosphomethylpyrimidine kinase|uniref:bifunctional hydroxymethylpyrimidine kinase/phosphomethylpyrimidine kinase n=1 Tax=Marispirochaeta sp. TaxID=2038653 RepID=UPI0029C6B385|nr:bifunctional hydroxymethylpyrimidine kinase/phosphomethylpyrimidine kinase [Marispirochaeta sp.]